MKILCPQNQPIDSYSIRKDHHDGVNALYRMSAVMNTDIDPGALSQTERIQRLMDTVGSWSVVPSEIVVFTGRVELHWYTKGFQMVMKREQYLSLIQQFQAFLSYTKTINLKFLERCLIEDPIRSVWPVPNQLVNFSPQFTSECFGLDEQEIKVLILNERLEVVA
ncbi:hypothetical protein [Virgibacillus sp. L01]|uniref:hypothetical protein n=1 Tax=Virgibacillus sp. L01 TaxID=3457429 RepID=UPI003FD09848